MPLNWEKLFVPFAKGMQEKVDEKLLPIDTPISLVDCYFDKTGALAKRPGFDKMAATLQSGGSVVNGKAIFSTGEELCIVGKTKLYAYVDSVSKWFDRGFIAPATGNLRTIYHAQKSYPCSDVSVNGAYIGYLATEYKQTGVNLALTNAECSIVFSIRNDSNQTVLPRSVRSGPSTDPDNRPHSPRMWQCTNKLMLGWAEGTPAGAGVAPVTLTVEAYDVSTFTGPAAAFTHADMYYSVINQRCFDGTEIVGGDYFYCYIQDTTQNVVGHVRNSSHAIQRSITITGDFFLVAICDSPLEDAVYIAVYEVSGVGPDKVRLYKRLRSTLGAVWGPIDIYSLADGETIIALGVQDGNDGATDQVSVCFTVMTNPGLIDSEDGTVTPPRELRVICGGCDSATGGSLLFNEPIFNSALLTRPWWVNNRCYIGLGSYGHGTYFESYAHMDIDCGPAPRDPVLAGVYDVGKAPPKWENTTEGLTNLGSANSVYAWGSGTKRIHMSTSLAFDYIGDGQGSGEPERMAADAIELDYDEAPTAVTVSKGCAAIGGSLVCWYDGSFVTELGFVHSPRVTWESNYAVLLGSGPGLPNAAAPGKSYTFYGEWQYYDTRGNLHRSIPSPPKEAKLISTDVAIELKLRTMGLTSRLSRPTMGGIIYRQGSDGVSRRINEPTIHIENIDTASGTASFNDEGKFYTGSVLGAPLYTTDGAEIEAVSPEGARIVKVSNGRLWFGDMYRRERVQFSKRFAPVTATEDAKAPETNEAFGFVLPSGLEITAMETMDGKSFIFSKTEINVVAGSGPDAGGGSDDHSNIRTVAADVGAAFPHVTKTPFGIMFVAQSGIHLLDRSHSVVYKGESVQDKLNSYPTVTSAVLVESEKQVRFTCENASNESVCLVYDYRMDAWSVWDLINLGDVVGACMHNNVYHILSSDGSVWKENYATGYDNAVTFFGMVVKMPWVQYAGQHGWQSIKYAAFLAEKKDATKFQVEIAHDFKSSVSETVSWDNATMNTFDSITSNVINPKFHPATKKCHSYQIVIKELEDAATVTGRGFRLLGVRFEIAKLRGVYKPGESHRNA